jgi:biopolymer transport protein ExbD
MAGKTSSSGGTISEPNVIPFIDILLVLLIIFMVTAPIPTVDVRVDLPPPNPIQSPPPPGQKPTIVWLRELPGQGLVVYVDAEPVAMSQLGDKVLDHAFFNNEALRDDLASLYTEARITVKADQTTAYGNVIDAMSRLQEAGFLKVGIFSERAIEG